MIKIKDSKHIFINGKRLISLKNMLSMMFLILLPIAVFFLFIFSDGGKNFAALAGFTDTVAAEMTVNPPTTTSHATNEYTEEVTEVPNLFDDKDGPVDFLEEILPILTPDPSKVNYEVAETDASGAKNIDGLLSVKDTSDTGLNLADELLKEIDLGITDLSQPTVLIYHTHSCESYLKSFTGFYYADETFRNPTSNKNISIVGEAMADALNAAGINTIHDTTLHDSPAFNGAYSRSAETVQSYLEKYPSIKITIDVHRDAMVTDTGKAYKPTTTINGKKAAQMMIIAGADPTGDLEYDNWYENLLFALKLQKQAEDSYDGLMRPLMFCQRSYNMWLTDSSFLVEVGSHVNTFSEAEYSGYLMGTILADLIHSLY